MINFVEKHQAKKVLLDHIESNKKQVDEIDEEVNEDLKKIFRTFSDIDDSISRKVGKYKTPPYHMANFRIVFWNVVKDTIRIRVVSGIDNPIYKEVNVPLEYLEDSDGYRKMRLKQLKQTLIDERNKKIDEINKEMAEIESIK